MNIAHMTDQEVHDLFHGDFARMSDEAIREYAASLCGVSSTSAYLYASGGMAGLRRPAGNGSTWEPLAPIPYAAEIRLCRAQACYRF